MLLFETHVPDNASRLTIRTLFATLEGFERFRNKDGKKYVVVNIHEGGETLVHEAPYLTAECRSDAKHADFTVRFNWSGEAIVANKNSNTTMDWWYGTNQIIEMLQQVVGNSSLTFSISTAVSDQCGD